MKMIGICGGSCSGKSTLVKELSKKLDNLAIVHFDDFFVGKDEIKNKKIRSWEDPSLYRYADYEDCLQKLANGKSVKIIANSREARNEGVKYRVLTPTDYVIVEGFLIYYTGTARRMFDKKIYIDITEEEIVRRRYLRMKEGGGQYSDNYIRNTLIQGHKKLVVPQKRYADLIIDAKIPTKEACEKALGFILE